MIARTSKIMLEVVIASLIGLVLITAAVAWRLTQGPVSLAFLTPEIEEALNSQGAPVHIQIDKTVLTWAGWSRPLDVRVVGVRAIAANGKAVASVPEMSVRFSGRALLDGVVAPTSLEMIGARLRLVRTRDGTIELALGETEQPSGDMLAGLAAAIAEPPSRDRPIGYLNRVSVFRGQLTIDDRMTGTEWGAPRADVVLARQGGIIRADFGLDIDIGGGMTRIDGSGFWHPETRRINVDANFSGLRPDRIAAKLPAISMAAALQMPLAGHVAFDMLVDGEVRNARFTLSGKDGRIDLADFWPSGLPLKTLEASGQYDAEPSRLSIDSLKLDLGGPTIALRGSAVRIDERMAIDGSATLRGFPVSSLARYWPRKLGAKARKWVTTHLSDGTVEQADVDASLRADGSAAGMTVQALSGSLRAAGTTVRFMDGMPPVRHADATGVFARDQMVFNVSKGDVEGLHIDGGTVRLSALDTDHERAAVETVIRGPLANIMAVIDRPRLGYAKAIGIDPAKTAGVAAVRLVVTLPLEHDVKFKDIDIAAAANLRNAAVPAIAYGQNLKDGTLTVKVDKRAMSVEGTATIGPAPVSLKWYERFGGGPGYARRYEVKGTFDDAARAAFGLAFPSYLRGPVAVDFSLAGRADGDAEASLRLELDKATLAIPAIGWSKPPGTAGLAFMTLELQKKHLASIPDFSIATPRLRASGSLQFAAHDRIAALDLRRFRLGATDISGGLVGRTDGGYDITLHGPGLDAAPLLRRENSSDTDLPPLTIDLRLGSLWFSTGLPLRNANARLVFDGKLWRTVDLAGSFGGKRNVALKVATSGTKRSLSFESSDAGATLRALNIANTVNGGRMLLALTRDASKDDSPWRGNFAMRDINVVKAPILARTLALASFTGITNALTGKGIQFASVDVPLVFRDGVARIENARAVGSELGLTANGEINLGTSRLRLDGTIVPAYTINSVLGNIPLLGDLLTGDKGSGVFAATYSMQGPLDDPKVSVNPLAALAPGFLRNLLGIITGGGDHGTDNGTAAPAAPPAGPRGGRP